MGATSVSEWTQYARPRLDHEGRLGSSKDMWEIMFIKNKNRGSFT